MRRPYINLLVLLAMAQDTGMAEPAVELLLRLGADIEAQNPKDNQRLTPLLFHASGTSGHHNPGGCEWFCKGVEILLTRGAYPFATSARSHSRAESGKCTYDHPPRTVIHLPTTISGARASRMTPTSQESIVPIHRTLVELPTALSILCKTLALNLEALG